MAKRSSLSIRIVEGKNLPAKDITGSSDPYCIVKVDNESIIRTATVWKTLCPFWGEEYQVHLPPTFHTVAFYVMDEDALSRDDVIGKVCLTRDMLASHPKGFSGWTHLMEVDPNEEVQGEIHLRLEVVPGTHASRLRCSVLEARDLAPKDRNGASDPFVRVYYNGQTQETSVVKKSCYPRWNETFEFELEEGAIGALLVEAWDWDLVSRNDFLGKVVVNVQRLCSAQQEEGWFQLQPDQSKSQRGQCSGLHRPQTEDEVLEQSAHTLRTHLMALLSAICRSVRACPAVVRATFRQLFQRVRERFPTAQHQNVPFIAVTSFLCLRFFSPAILSPKLFHLRERHADARTSRTLLLLAKAVQIVGNMDTAVSRAKEAWMEPLQPTVRQGVVQMKDFITKLIDIEEKEELDLQRALNSQAPPVKEGPLFIHRTKGKGPLASSFKKLYFSLTTEALSFSKTASSKKSVFIKLASIRAVEKVEEKSFGSSHVMQVIYADDVGRAQTVYLQCKCVNELNQWLSALRKVSIDNRSLLASYHPGIFRGDKWSCCHQKNKTDLGCDKTHSRVTLQEWSDPLDHDLEAQLIFRHLLGVEAALREKYRILSGETETGISPTGRGGAPEDPLAQLFHVLQDLQDAHSSSLAGPPPREPHRLLELQT
ncbi:ras GTPase-activating protein 4 isoform X3 [Psammomys obesus]|uniref:ras GTPase-activating protein 4 isoform X3 n=1 Tax=Psammomys obesus TaxID=48139 RepID=UPI00245286FA|nr:ras GTPase-activating protein 4 isoform X3 [Psammomys obesus]